MIVGAFEREQLASACGDSLAGHDARSLLQAAHEVLFVVVRKDVLAHPQQLDHHRVAARAHLVGASASQAAAFYLCAYYAGSSVFGTNSMTPRGAMPVSHDTTPSSGTFFEIATW